jgi:hypothetical protein
MVKWRLEQPTAVCPAADGLRLADTYGYARTRMYFVLGSANVIIHRWLTSIHTATEITHWIISTDQANGQILYC